ncbi:MAG: hypothetical protein NWE91_01495 [Candidatus Bathyarchaeota archaeon]|nr:hypothetical protein [Candidatus Bathyarchaeota archaeon]
MEMPLAIKWSWFTKDSVSRETNNYGVYELGNADGILYIGEGHVYSRLMAHFADGSEPIVGASYYRVEYTGSKERAVQRQNAELSAYKRKHGKYPSFVHRKG